MHVWQELAQVPNTHDGAAVTIGIFDGVHTGHRAVLSELVSAGQERQVPAVVVTFDPHPLVVHRPDDAPEMLTGFQDRADLLAETGVDAVLVLAYTEAFAAQSPREFVRRYFVDGLKAQAVVVGADIRFGKDNSGDINTLKTLGEEFGFDTIVVADHPVNGTARRASSTWVRQLLAAGDARAAARILGRPHRVRGTVVHGQARGREMGFPTANLSQQADGIIPADGIYAGWLHVPGGLHPTRMPAAISVGANATFDEVTRVVEAHVLGRTDLDLYGDQVIVEFVQQLRPMLKFDTVDELIAQMNYDVDHAADILGVPRPTNRIGWQTQIP
ncbi:MAG TPA: bifunctional riboflavin kinase/FAD synthetase [Beutenbergiaceae bacterium]|nr:bifunctional riboflavin kinase/FAD synthetase [Beutenbergiaceae bacterium]